MLAGSVATRATAAIAAPAQDPPTVELQPGDFARSAITIGLGQTVGLPNDSPVPHVIANGRWDGATTVPDREAAAPLAERLRVDRLGHTLELGPFTAAGSSTYYCPLHPGMNLTITAR